MFYRVLLLILLGPTLAGGSLAGASPVTHPTLRRSYADAFLLGVALNTSIVRGQAPQAAALAAQHFSALTAENDMKWQHLQPEPGRFEFAAADAYLDFAARHDMAVIGHTLVWHSQTPRWVFESRDGTAVSREALLQRMRDHIHAVVGRYRGRVKGWDVVNEAIADGGAQDLRDSPWRRIIGDDFIEHAFRFAREADPGAELYYNDYNLEDPQKRARALALVRRLQQHGVPIDGIGTQGHYHLDYPSLTEVEKTITQLGALGLRVMITELDVDVLPQRGRSGVADVARREAADPSLDPYTAGLPDEVQQRLARRYTELFEVFFRQREHVSRVTFWGLHDGQTWLNHFPVRGRTNHPLLFDRELRPKPAFSAVQQVPAASGAAIATHPTQAATR